MLKNLWHRVRMWRKRRERQRIAADVERAAYEAVITAAFQTGKPVLGELKDDGTLIVRVIEED